MVVGVKTLILGSSAENHLARAIKQLDRNGNPFAARGQHSQLHFDMTIGKRLALVRVAVGDIDC